MIPVMLFDAVPQQPFLRDGTPHVGLDDGTLGLYDMTTSMSRPSYVARTHAVCRILLPSLRLEINRAGF